MIEDFIVGFILGILCIPALIGTLWLLNKFEILGTKKKKGKKDEL
jgi:hypothetical protein